MTRRLWVGMAIGSLLMGVAAAQLVGTKSTDRISVSSTGAQSNGDSTSPSISGDEHSVAFESTGDNLVPGDTNGVSDIFVRDWLTGTTDLVSLSSREVGMPGNGRSYDAAISSDARYVAFVSEADNLVIEDTSGIPNVFLRDRMMGTTELISVSASGAPGLEESDEVAISADGGTVAFTSLADNLVPGDTNGNQEVFVRDRRAGRTERVSLSTDGKPADRGCGEPAITFNGRYVAFSSDATNLVPGDTNGDFDIFVRDRVAGTTERISVASDGAQSSGNSGRPSISLDGRYVAFFSGDENLVPGDTNGVPDVFVRDRMAGTTERVSVVSSTPPESQDEFFWGQSSMGGNGRYVAFVFHSRIAGDTKGRWQIFVRDRETRRTEPVSLSSNDTPGNGASLLPVMSGDGRYVAFVSTADNLVPDDTNSRPDIFVRDRAGRAADLTVEPQSLLFDRIEVGTKQTRSLTLRNAGTTRVAGSVGTLAEPFAVVGGSGPFSLAAGDSQRVTVAFAPNRASLPGEFRAALVIAVSDPNAGTVIVPVAGESVGVDVGGAGRLELAPTREQGLTLMLAARAFVYGVCTDGTITLRNAGTGPLSGRVERLPNPFTVAEGDGDFVLAPGQSRKVVVRFCAPVGSLPMRFETTLLVTSSDPAHARVDVPVRVQLP